MQAIVKMPWGWPAVSMGAREPLPHLHGGGGAPQGDLEGVHVEPGADVEHQLLGEGGAQLEGAADEAGHLLGAVGQLLVELLGVGLLQGEQVGPGLGARVAQVEAPQHRHHVVQRVRVGGVDPGAGVEEVVALGGVQGRVGAGGGAERPGAARAEHVRHRAELRRRRGDAERHAGRRAAAALGAGGREVDEPVAGDAGRLRLPARTRHYRHIPAHGTRALGFKMLQVTANSGKSKKRRRIVV